MNRQVARLGGIPAIAPDVSPSPVLFWTIGQMVNPHPDVGPPRDYPARVQAEAKTIADAMRPWCLSVPPAHIAKWLEPICDGVVNPPDQAAMVGRIRAICAACEGLAIGAFTVSTQRSALRQFRLMPAAAEVFDLVVGESRRLRLDLELLDRIAQGRTTPELPPEAIPELWSGSPPEPPRLLPEPVAPLRTVAEQLRALGIDQAPE